MNTEEGNHSDIHWKRESDLTKSELNLGKNDHRKVLKIIMFM